VTSVKKKVSLIALTVLGYKGNNNRTVRVFVRKRQRAFKVHFYILYSTIRRHAALYIYIRHGFNSIVYHLRWLVREIKIKKKERKNISYMENITTAAAASSDDDRSVISLSARISIFPAKTLTDGLLRCCAVVVNAGSSRATNFSRVSPIFFHFFFYPGNASSLTFTGYWRVLHSGKSRKRQQEKSLVLFS